MKAEFDLPVLNDSKVDVTLDLNEDVLFWFKTNSNDFEACINAILRNAMESQQ